MKEATANIPRTYSFTYNQLFNAERGTPHIKQGGVEVRTATDNGHSVVANWTPSRGLSESRYIAEVDRPHVAGICAKLFAEGEKDFFGA